MFEFLSWSYYLEADIETALKYTKLILLEDPHSEYYLRNRDAYEYYIKYNITVDYDQTKYMAAAQTVLDKSQNSSYMRTCRGIPYLV